MSKRMRKELDVDVKIVLVAPEIPQNTGTIGRLCVCLDLDLHLIKPLGFLIDEASVRRAGLDYWKHVRLHVHEDWDAFLASAQPERMVFLSSKGTRTYYEHPYRDGDFLVFGSESKGLPPDFYTRYAEQLMTIPMPGEYRRSLNLSNAASIVAYEAYRQIHVAPSSGSGA